MNDREQMHPLVERKDPTNTAVGAARPSLIGPANESSPISSEPSNNAMHLFELHIEELALHGFAPGDSYRIGDAIERELTRIFTEQGMPPAITEDTATGYVDGGSIEISAPSDGETIAVPLARAIYGGFEQ